MAERQGLMELEARRRLYRYIEENPGIHLRGISRGLAMPLGTVEYHLHQMERSGVVTTREEGRFKAFFAAQGIDRRDKDILYYVRQEMPRRIVLHLLEHPGATHTEVSAVVPVGASTVSFHLKKLVTAGVVQETRDGRTKHFQVAEPERAAGVLIRYRKSFLDDLVDRFARIWFTMDAQTGETRDDAAPPERPGASSTDDASKRAPSSVQEKEQARLESQAGRLLRPLILALRAIFPPTRPAVRG